MSIAFSRLKEKIFFSGALGLALLPVFPEPGNSLAVGIGVQRQGALTPALSGGRHELGSLVSQGGFLKPKVINGNIPERNAEVTIQNPHRFYLQEKIGTSGQWIPIGSDQVIRRSIKYQQTSAIKVQYRLVSKDHPEYAYIYNSRPQDNIYSQTVYQISLGLQGFETGFKVCSEVQGGCRSAGEQIKAINNDRAEILINPPAAKLKVFAGLAQLVLLYKPEMHGQAFLRIGASDLSEACGRITGNKKFVQYYGGKINGEQANGSAKSYSALDPIFWCTSNWSTKSGFVQLLLDYPQIVAIAESRSNIFSGASIAPLVVPPDLDLVCKLPPTLRPFPVGSHKCDSQQVDYWQVGSGTRFFYAERPFATLTDLLDENTSLGPNIVSRIERLANSSNAQLFAVQDIVPRSQPLYLNLVDLAPVIKKLQNIKGRLVTCGRRGVGNKWCFSVDSAQPSEVDIAKILKSAGTSYKGLTIDNQPRSLSVVDVNVYSRDLEKGSLEIDFTISLDKLEGEIVNDNWFDYDYKLTQGSLRFNIPLLIKKTGQTFSVVLDPVRCPSNKCMDPVRMNGFEFSLPNIPSELVSDIEKKASKAFKDAITDASRQSVRDQITAITDRKFPFPQIDVPGVSNPLEDFVGINRDIVPNLEFYSPSRNELTLRLRYSPQVPLVTPSLMRQKIPFQFVPAN